MLEWLTLARGVLLFWLLMAPMNLIDDWRCGRETPIWAVMLTSVVGAVFAGLMGWLS